MSQQIDWSKAPEGYPLWITDPDGIIMPGWHKEIKGKYVDMHGGFWNKSDGGFTVHERPTTPSWSGEGLPPVGVDIEVMHELYGWIGARVVGQDGEAAIVRTNDGYAGVFPHQMRPIRTPEQIAADEREKFAEELTRAMAMDGRPRSMEQARRMYDLGYRKP